MPSPAPRPLEQVCVTAYLQLPPPRGCPQGQRPQLSKQARNVKRSERFRNPFSFSRRGKPPKRRSYRWCQGWGCRGHGHLLRGIGRAAIHPRAHPRKPVRVHPRRCPGGRGVGSDSQEHAAVPSRHAGSCGGRFCRLQGLSEVRVGTSTRLPSPFDSRFEQRLQGVRHTAFDPSTAPLPLLRGTLPSTCLRPLTLSPSFIRISPLALSTLQCRGKLPRRHRFPHRGRPDGKPIRRRVLRRWHEPHLLRASEVAFLTGDHLQGHPLDPR